LVAPSRHYEIQFKPQDESTMSKLDFNSPKLFGQWVRTTWAGWALGVPCIVVLALAGEAVGLGGVQVLVGAGMGAGVGMMQARALRNVLQTFAPWLWSCVIGLGAPFLATDVAKAIGRPIPYSLEAYVALGGLIVGVWQWLILRSRFHHAAWWILASALGWSLAAGAATIANVQPFRGLLGALLYLAIAAAGGLVLGSVTGLALARRLREKTVG
jgi:hypothetical protein